MDLNQLYFEHQSSQMLADGGASDETRGAHGRHAIKVAGCISDIQIGLGAAAAASWTAHAARAAASGKAQKAEPDRNTGQSRPPATPEG